MKWSGVAGSFKCGIAPATVVLAPGCAPAQPKVEPPIDTVQAYGSEFTVSYIQALMPPGGCR